MLFRLPIIVLVGVILIGLIFIIMNRSITKNIMTIEEEITKYNEIVEKNSLLKAENSKMEYFIKRVKNIENSTTKTSTILAKINSYVPKEITFMSLSFSDTGSINISGESDTYSAIPEFLANLEMSEEFYNVTISYINPIEKTIEISEAAKEGANILEGNSLLPIAMAGNFNIWENLILASDDSKENNITNNDSSTNNNSNNINDSSNLNNSQESNDSNKQGSSTYNDSNSTSGEDSNDYTTSSNTITKYSFSILIEGVSKDGSEAKETE